MNRKEVINIIENVLPPLASEAIKKGLFGAESNETTLTSETTLSLDFTKNNFQKVNLGSANITINGVVDGLKEGEKVFLKIVQDSTAARTVTFGTNLISGDAVTSSINAVDLFEGVFDGTNIIFGGLALNAS